MTQQQRSRVEDLLTQDKLSQLERLELWAWYFLLRMKLL